MGSGRHRVLVGGFSHELNSFVPGISTTEVLARAGAIVRRRRHLRPGRRRSGLERHAIADVAARGRPRPSSPRPTCWAASGRSSPTRSMRRSATSILAGAREHPERHRRRDARPLHGAMATVSRSTTPRATSSRAVREIVGPDVPIVATFDMHGHGTALMAANADALLGYRTCPHTDYYGTGERAMRILVRAMDGEIEPVVSTRKIRMTASSEHHDTNHGPMVDVQAMARELERRPGVLDVTVLATQPWMDVPEHRLDRLRHDGRAPERSARRWPTARSRSSGSVARRSASRRRPSPRRSPTASRSARPSRSSCPTAPTRPAAAATATGTSCSPSCCATMPASPRC